ncbi:MAG: hypothetical protein WCJ51_01760 [Candidatus Moraniibacteriota bacterium]
MWCLTKKIEESVIATMFMRNKIGGYWKVMNDGSIRKGYASKYGAKRTRFFVNMFSISQISDYRTLLKENVIAENYLIILNLKPESGGDDISFKVVQNGQGIFKRIQFRIP